MSQRGVSLVKRAALFFAAWLFLVPQALAGEHVRAASSSPTSPQPAPAPSARVWSRPVTFAVVPVTISVAVTKPAQPASEQVYVDLRSPDGRRRTFTVEGGPSAIQTQPVLVLRPGQSVTIRLVAK